jgi:hypothetical protein
VPLTLLAEIRPRLLPGSYTCEAGQFALASWLEPAGNNAGDTFDFALARNALHLSLTDAMGHNLDAALIATVLVGALRNARRSGHDLQRQAASVNTVLAGHVHPASPRPANSCTSTWTRRPPCSSTPATSARFGSAADASSPSNSQPTPFGTVPDYQYRVQPLALEPGDRLLFLTDGMLERNAASVDTPALMAASADLHPREADQRRHDRSDRRLRRRAQRRRHRTLPRLARRTATRPHHFRAAPTADTAGNRQSEQHPADAASPSESISKPESSSEGMVRPGRS